MLKVFCSPSRYTQGPHATAQLGEEIRGLGLEGPALIVAGGSAIRLLSQMPPGLPLTKRGIQRRPADRCTQAEFNAQPHETSGLTYWAAEAEG